MKDLPTESKWSFDTIFSSKMWQLIVLKTVSDCRLCFRVCPALSKLYTVKPGLKNGPSSRQRTHTNYQEKSKHARRKRILTHVTSTLIRHEIC